MYAYIHTFLHTCMHCIAYIHACKVDKQNTYVAKLGRREGKLARTPFRTKL